MTMRLCNGQCLLICCLSVFLYVNRIAQSLQNNFQEALWDYGLRTTVMERIRLKFWVDGINTKWPSDWHWQLFWIPIAM